MEVKCPRCGVHGEFVDNKCPICDFLLEEENQLTFLQKASKEIWSVKVILTMVAFFLVGSFLRERGFMIGTVLFKISLYTLGTMALYKLFQRIAKIDKLSWTWTGEGLIVLGLILLFISLRMDTTYDGYHIILVY